VVVTYCFDGICLRSTVYERISVRGQRIAEFIGYTQGSGTFHISQPVYEKMLLFLKQHGRNTDRGYGTGPSRKLKLIDRAFGLLNIPKFSFHNIKRGYYIFSNSRNLDSVLHRGKRPLWHDRPFNELSAYWKERWCIPRSRRTDEWRKYDSDHFFRRVERQIKQLN